MFSLFFFFFNFGGRNAKEYHFMVRDSYIKSKFQSPSGKFYWQTAAPIHLGVVWLFSKWGVETLTQTVWPAKPKMFI